MTADTTLQLTTLPSGLRIVTDTMPHVASASIGLWFGVGARFEPAHENGLSHLLEHMFFKGTETRSAKVLNQTIETVGGSLNAYTSREQTAYTARILAEDAPLALELLADMMLHSRFDEADLVREKSVVSAEIGEAYDAPDDWVFDLLQSTAYPDQPLGRAVLGTEKTLTTITRQQLFDYVQTHYRADCCVLAAAGAVEHERIVSLAEKLFTPLKAGGTDLPDSARYKGGTITENRDIEQLHMCLGHQGVTYSHPLFYAQSLFVTALGGNTSSRLFHEIREERGLAYSVSAFMQPFRDDGLMVIYMAADADRAREAYETALVQLHDLALHITQDELDRARAITKANILMSLESTENRAERMASQLLQHNRLIPLEETIESLARVTLADVKCYAEMMLATPLTRVAVGPVRELGWS